MLSSGLSGAGTTNTEDMAVCKTIHQGSHFSNLLQTLAVYCMAWSYPLRGVEIENAGHGNVADLPISIQRLVFVGSRAHNTTKAQGYRFTKNTWHETSTAIMLDCGHAMLQARKRIENMGCIYAVRPTC